MISLFCSQAIANHPLTIYGDGLQTRDFVHVSDVVNAVIAAIRGDAEASGVFNVGSGNPCTIRDVANIIRTACHSRSVIKPATPRAGDVRHSAQMSAQPPPCSISGHAWIEDGLPDTVAWFTADAASSRTDGGRALPRFSGGSTPGEPQRSATPPEGRALSSWHPLPQDQGH